MAKKEKKVLELDGGDGCTMQIYQFHRNVPLKMVKMVNFMLFMFYCNWFFLPFFFSF